MIFTSICGTTERKRFNPWFDYDMYKRGWLRGVKASTVVSLEPLTHRHPATLSEGKDDRAGIQVSMPGFDSSQTCDSKLSWGVNVSVSVLVCLYVSRMITCPGCTLIAGKASTPRDTPSVTAQFGFLSPFFLKLNCSHCLLKFDPSVNWSQPWCDPADTEEQHDATAVSLWKSAGTWKPQMWTYTLGFWSKWVEEEWREWECTVYCSYGSLWSSGCYFITEECVDPVLQSVMVSWRDKGDF